jgi:hypothetical protein
LAAALENTCENALISHQLGRGNLPETRTQHPVSPSFGKLALNDSRWRIIYQSGDDQFRMTENGQRAYKGVEHISGLKHLFFCLICMSDSVTGTELRWNREKKEGLGQRLI